MYVVKKYLILLIKILMFEFWLFFVGGDLEMVVIYYDWKVRENVVIYVILGV